MTMRHRLKTGFTIIELIVVVSVIAILATLSAVAYSNVTRDARDASVLSDLDALDPIETQYSADNSTGGKAWYSGGGVDVDLNFTPSTGNVIDVVVTAKEYCIRGYNPGAAKNSIANAYLKDSSGSACNKLIPSAAAVAASPVTNTTQVTTFAGSVAGYIDGSSTAARFNWPWDVAFGASGNLFIADAENYRIRKITPAGVVSTFAGSGAGVDWTNGVGTAADFVYINCIGSDASGNIYVCDLGNKIRKITPEGVVSTLTSSAAGAGLDVDASGNLYVATGAAGSLIKKVTPDGTTTTFAGSTTGFADGLGTAAQFSSPKDVVVDPYGNVFVADDNNYRIRKITPAGNVTTIAGGTFGNSDGVGAAAQFDDIRSIAIDLSGNLYVTDRNRIRKITQAGAVTTIAGITTAGLVNGTGVGAQFSSLQGITFNAYGELYISDRANNLIRKMQ